MEEIGSTYIHIYPLDLVLPYHLLFLISSRSLISAGSSIPWIFPHLVDNVVSKVNDILTSNSKDLGTVFRDGHKGKALQLVP